MHRSTHISPDYFPHDSPEWLHSINSVVAFATQGDLRPDDVRALWMFCLSVDPCDYDTEGQWLAEITPDKLLR